MQSTGENNENNETRLEKSLCGSLFKVQQVLQPGLRIDRKYYAGRNISQQAGLADARAVVRWSPAGVDEAYLWLCALRVGPGRRPCPVSPDACYLGRSP